MSRIRRMHYAGKPNFDAHVEIREDPTIDTWTAPSDGYILYHLTWLTGNSGDQYGRYPGNDSEDLPDASYLNESNHRRMSRIYVRTPSGTTILMNIAHIDWATGIPADTQPGIFPINAGDSVVVVSYRIRRQSGDDDSTRFYGYGNIYYLQTAAHWQERVLTYRPYFIPCNA